MTAWVIRGGKYAEREDEALENGFLTIGFGIIKSLDNVQTPDEVAGCLDLSGNETNQQLASRVSQVWAFKDGIKTGDTVVMPRKGPSVLAVGRITGEYTYRPEQPEFSHARAVEWINQAVPNSLLPEKLQGSMNGLRTIYQPSPGRRRRTIAGGCQRRPGRSHKDAGASGVDTSWSARNTADEP